MHRKQSMITPLFDFVEVVTNNFTCETAVLTVRTSDIEFIEQRLHEPIARMLGIALVYAMSYSCFSFRLGTIGCEYFEGDIALSTMISGQPYSGECPIAKFMDYAVSAIQKEIVQLNGMESSGAIVFEILYVLLPLVPWKGRHFSGPSNVSFKSIQIGSWS